LIFILASCTQSADTKKIIVYREEKLDSASKYKISLPDDYRIESQRGADFNVYFLQSRDSVPSRLGSAGIYIGYFPEPPRPEPDSVLIKESSKHAMILGQDAIWTIYEYKGHLTAQATISQNDLKIDLFSSAGNYSKLDSMIKILGSLK